MCKKTRWCRKRRWVARRSRAEFRVIKPEVSNRRSLAVGSNGTREVDGVRVDEVGRDRPDDRMSIRVNSTFPPQRTSPARTQPSQKFFFMAPLTRSKGAAPSLELPARGGTKKAPAVSAELPSIQSKKFTDLIGDLESPLTSMASLRPDNSVRGSGPVSIDEKGLSTLPVKEESVASDDFDLRGNQGGRSNANEPTSADYDTALDTDLLDLREESVVLHPDDVRGWEKVGKFRGRRTLSPNPSSNLTGHSVKTGNRFDILSNANDGNEVAIEKTVKFVHDERQKYFEKRLGNLLNQFDIDREQKRQAANNVNENIGDPSVSETVEYEPPVVNKGKVRDFRDTGIPGIENRDLDPENQRRAWANFDFLRDEDPELQKVIYEGIVNSWNTFKKKTANASTNVAGSSNDARQTRQVEIVAESYGEDDVSDDQSRATPTPAEKEVHLTPARSGNKSPREGNVPSVTPTVSVERSGDRENENFAPPITSTPTIKPQKKVKIVEVTNDGMTLDSDTGAATDKSDGSSLPLLKADNSGGIKAHSPMTGLVNRPGNPHLDLRNMISVSRKAMQGGINRSETPNVRTGPAFAADQVAPNSFLGKLLKKSGSGNGMGVPPEEPGDPGSEPSYSDHSDNESGPSGDDSTPETRRKKKSKSHHASERPSWDKPIPPSPYNGSDDPKKVARFIQECEQYLKMAQVADEDKVFRISRYLEGSARDFYDQSVSMNYNQWDIDTFFWELFNYCFPRDYRAKVRRKIKQCFQGSRDVRTYSHELKGQYHMLGDESERTQVLRLWFGLRQDLREELKARYYDEEVNTWEEIVDMAEILDISRRQDHTPKPARQSFNDELRELSGVPRKGPVRNWEKPVRDKSGPWRENRLNKKKRDEYLADGKCFRCGKLGHLSRQCPDGNTVSSGSKAGPPGSRRPPQMSSSNIQFKLKEADRLSKLAESSSGLQLNSIGLRCVDDVSQDDSQWSSEDAAIWLEQPMGDMLGEWWTWRMNSVAVWPDSGALPPPKIAQDGSSGRFHMYRTKKMNYVLFDSAYDDRDELLVPADIVQYGDMISWYNRYLVLEHGIPFVHYVPLLAKDLTAAFIEEYLEDGFNEDFRKVMKRFTVSYKSPNVFKVKDRALGHEFPLCRAAAVHPQFRLYNWWLSRVMRWERRQLGFACWAGSKIGLAGMEGEYVGDSGQMEFMWAT
ncbi:hypothetical protein IW262DRAFT_1552778 [Armillaria fumosa]|nr:hypothetical protein IW262DRAFT_1552778 [Armillaria fumosa]